MIIPQHILGVCLSLLLAFVSESPQPSSTSPQAGGVLLIWLICFLARKKPIGGWLLFYIIGLYLALLVRLIQIFPPLSCYSPAPFEGKADYIVFLITTVPLDLVLIAQLFLSFWLVSHDKRDWKHIEILKRVLLTGIAIAIACIPIDAALWPDNIFFDVYPATYWLIWFLYFRTSDRIRHVFKYKQWDWEIFHNRKSTQSK